MKYLITGGTGFIGRALVKTLSSRDHSITVLTRDPERAAVLFSSEITCIDSLDKADPADFVINLAGEPLFAHRWNADRKQRFIDSRVETTEALVQWMSSCPPRAFLSGSAIGYYGDKGDADVDENSPSEDDFASQLVQQWEHSARAAEVQGIRVCLLRTGLVVGPDGGFLKQMLLPYKLGLGGPLGSGKQWMSWIHLDDMVGLILHACEREIRGPINCTAPEPVQNQTFNHCLGKVLRRPACLRVPAVMLSLAVGESAYMLLSGQKVLPVKALKTGYRYRYPDLEAALRDAVV